MLKAIFFVALCAILSTVGHADQFVIINGHRMISLRAFSQDFGAVVQYDDNRNAISIALGNRVVEVIPYSTTAWIDGTPVAVANPVVIADDVTYVPLRFICHAFNLNTNWYNGNQQVYIVNPYTSAQVFFQIDASFGQRSHVFRRDYDNREYRNVPPPAHPTAPYRTKNAGNGYGGRPQYQGGGQPRGGYRGGGATGSPRGGGGQPQGGGPRGGGQPQGGGPRGGGQPQGGGQRGGGQPQGGGQRGGENRGERH